MITNIQYLRAFAALAVVLYHTAIVYPLVGHTELHGVLIFFVISGFIIPFVATKSPLEFGFDRLIRVVPIYWCVTIFMAGWEFISWKIRVAFLIAMVLLSLLHLINEDKCSEFIKNRIVSIFICIVIFYWAYRALHAGLFPVNMHFIKSLLFFPDVDSLGVKIFPTLGVGWTLNMEVMFYLVFGALLVMGRTVAACATAIIFALLVAVRNSLLSSFPSLVWYGDLRVLCFCAGLILFVIFQREWKVSGRVAIFLSAVLGIFFFYSLSEGLPEYSILYFAGPISIVGAGLILHRGGFVGGNKTILKLGEVSYALYLVHEPVIETLRLLETKIHGFKVGGPLGITLSVLLSVIIACFINDRVDAPLRKWIKHTMSLLPFKKLAIQS